MLLPQFLNYAHPHSRLGSDRSGWVRVGARVYMVLRTTGRRTTEEEEEEESVMTSDFRLSTSDQQQLLQLIIHHTTRRTSLLLAPCHLAELHKKSSLSLASVYFLEPNGPPPLISFQVRMLCCIKFSHCIPHVCSSGSSCQFYAA